MELLELLVLLLASPLLVNKKGVGGVRLGIFLLFL